jgi:hypothetical protein
MLKVDSAEKPSLKKVMTGQSLGGFGKLELNQDELTAV